LKFKQNFKTNLNICKHSVLLIFPRLILIVKVHAITLISFWRHVHFSVSDVGDIVDLHHAFFNIDARSNANATKVGAAAIDRHHHIGIMAND
jgi:hypothetical protein